MSEVMVYEGKEYMISIARDVTERKKTEKEKERLITELQDALGKVNLESTEGKDSDLFERQ